MLVAGCYAATEAFPDLQYAGPNLVAFDIANHWCEYGADYHTDLPHILDYSRMPHEHQQVTTSPFLNCTFSRASRASVMQRVLHKCSQSASGNRGL